MALSVNFTQEMVSVNQLLRETSLLLKKDRCLSAEIIEIIELIRLIIISLIKWLFDFHTVFSNNDRGNQVVEGKLQQQKWKVESFW